MEPVAIPLTELYEIIAVIHHATATSDIPYRERIAACKVLHILKQELESIYATKSNR